MADDVKIVRPDAPRDVVSQQGPPTDGCVHLHCWHDTGTPLNSALPVYVERCCWCGAELRVQLGHGPYVPWARKVTP